MPLFLNRNTIPPLLYSPTQGLTTQVPVTTDGIQAVLDPADSSIHFSAVSMGSRVIPLVQLQVITEAEVPIMIQDLPVKGHDLLNIKGAMVRRDETLAEITCLVVGRKMSISQI